MSNMKIEKFCHNHIEKAMEIALLNYKEERGYVPFLPKVEQTPDLSHFAENGLGVVAMEGERMLGFLCAYYPREDAFGTTNVKGTFSPIHAHGIITSEEIRRSDIYIPYRRDCINSLLYQAAADKWVKEGIRSHAIALYTHDSEVVNSFFYNGFGLRCIDAIRSLEDIPTSVNTKLKGKEAIEYCEVPKDKWGLLLNYHNDLILHLGASPTFMHFDPIDEEKLYGKASKDVRYFAAKLEDKYIAYIKIADEGENFVTEDGSMMNICGAYCDPLYRGSGVYHNLLCYLMTTLKKDGYHLLGVDCESFNPNARGFWLKYFTEYTHSVVRRIDEKAVDCNIN